MVDTQDIWRKKSSGGFVSENPLSSAQARAANPLSSARPHASSASTVAKPQSSAPPNASTVSLRQGDTLWEVAQKKLGDGTRWHELHKADGRRFAGQEVKHLQVGTRVYLPGAKLTPSPASTVSVRQGDTLSEIAQKKLGDGNRWRELHKADGSRFTGQEARHLHVGARVYLPGAKPTTKTAHPGNSSFKTPNVPAQVFPTEGTTRRDYVNGSSHQKRNTQSWSSSDSTNNTLNLIGGVATGTVVGNFVRKSLSSAAVGVKQVPGASEAVRLVGRPLRTGDLNLLEALSNTQDKISKQLQHKVTGAQISKPDLGRVLKANNWQKKTIFELRRGGYQNASERPRTRIPLTRTTSITIVRGGTGKRNLSKTQLFTNENRDAEVRISRERQVGLPKRRPGWHEYARVANNKNQHLTSSSKPGKKALTHFALHPESRATRVVKTLRATRANAESRAASTTLRTARVVGESRAARTTLHAARAVKNSRAANTTLRAARAVSESRAARTTLHAATAVKNSRAANITRQAATAVGESGVTKGVLRGASRVAAPLAIGLDAWQLKNAYQKDGFGKEFRKEAGRVAGGWGGAAAGAVGGAAIGSVVPVVGTAAGAIVGGVIGGVAGSEFGDDIEQGAEKAGKEIAGGAKKAWNKLFG